MGRRSAVAATLVSLIVFTSLLVANSALYASQESALGAAVLSTAQTRERALGGILVGLAAYGALEAAQASLAGTVLDCSSAQAYLASLGGASSASGSQQGIEYSTSTAWAYASTPSGGDPPALLGQFGGYSPDGLNLLVSGSLSESYRGGLPWYSFSGSEDVHLPVPLTSTISDCQQGVAELGAALSSLAAPCNSSSVEEAVRVAEAGSPVLDPFQVNATATVAGLGCAVSYGVTRTLGGLEGPAGPFQVALRGEGSFVT
ncbi:MAG: hypothetical protein ABSF83_14540 [Nitrososphaerales archaeon]|jgi:hypothetical protein